MSNSVVVQFAYYAFDDGHHHWTDDYSSFDSVDDAQQFIADINRRIANGDTNIRPGHIVDTDELTGNNRRVPRTDEPTF